MNNVRHTTRLASIATLTIFGLFGSTVGCSSGTDTVTPAEVDPVEWSECDDFPDDPNVECGAVTVPLNYRDPEDETIEIALLRYPAKSGKAKGVVMVNNGGPGESGVDFVYYSGFDMMNSLGLEDFDIVGFDPRGVDRSGGLKCQTDAEIDRFINLDYTPDTDDEQAIYDEWYEMDDPCVEKYGSSLRHYSTENVARDMDMIRRAMGVERIDYLGISWGTYLGGVYATLFPEHVRTMFLDAAFDPQGDTADQTELTQAIGFEESFDAWVQWCEDSPESCSFSSSDVKAGWLDLAEQLDANPIVTADGREVNHVVMDLATISVLYSQDWWPRLGEALAAATNGDGEQLQTLADDWNGRYEDGTYDSSYDAFGIIECASGTYAYEPDDPEALFEQLREEAPWYSRDYTVDDLGASCASEYGDPKIFEVDVQGSIPIVVLGGTNDPATPLRWSQEIVERLGDNARLAIFDGEGHSHILDSRCVDEMAKDLFVSRALPSAGTECAPDVPIDKPTWWDDVVSIDAPRVDDATMDWFFDTDRVDAYAEYFAVPGDADEAFAMVREQFESRGWVYEEGDSADPVSDIQWFVDASDDSRAVGVWLSSPEELESFDMVEPEGIVPAGTSVVMVYHWP